MRFVVEDNKIKNYLLKDPAKFGFFGLYYHVNQWTILKDDLLHHAASYGITRRASGQYGDQYEAVGDIQTPTGRVISVRSGWIIEHNKPDTVRFVTAYPAH